MSNETNTNSPIQAAYADEVAEAVKNYPKAVELIQYFVDRVEAGSIKSTTTYGKYKEFLDSLKTK